MHKISGIIIAKNEEKMIKEALESLSFCDEIIVIDNESQDRTKEIAKAHKAKVYEFKSDSFSEMRNYGLSVATYDWILYLDADERVSEELGNSIKNILADGSKHSAFFLKRRNYYFGSSKKNEWPYVEKLERFFKKEKLKEWKGKLHESPVIDGDVGELEGHILHFTHRDLGSMVEKTIQWSETEALLRYNAGHPDVSWWRFPRVMISAFLKSYIKQRGYKAGTVGIIESIYQAFSAFVTYAKLWELQNKIKNQKSKIKNPI